MNEFSKMPFSRNLDCKELAQADYGYLKVTTLQLDKFVQLNGVAYYLVSNLWVLIMHHVDPVLAARLEAQIRTTSLSQTISFCTDLADRIRVNVDEALDDSFFDGSTIRNTARYDRTEVPIVADIVKALCFAKRFSPAGRNALQNDPYTDFLALQDAIDQFEQGKDSFLRQFNLLNSPVESGGLPLSTQRLRRDIRKKLELLIGYGPEDCLAGHCPNPIKSITGVDIPRISKGASLGVRKGSGVMVTESLPSWKIMRILADKEPEAPIAELTTEHHVIKSVTVYDVEISEPPQLTYSEDYTMDMVPRLAYTYGFPRRACERAYVYQAKEFFPTVGGESYCIDFIPRETYFKSSCVEGAGQFLPTGVYRAELVGVSGATWHERAEVTLLRMRVLTTKEYYVTAFQDVPKSFNKRRGIAIDTPYRMSEQLHAKDALEHALLTHSCADFFTPLRDQSQNQRFAKIGAQTGLLATEDISAASDGISYEAMLSCFPGGWARLLDRVRPTHTWNRLATKKLTGESMATYAIVMRTAMTMGCGTTFTMESAFFTAVALVAEDYASVFGEEWARTEYDQIDYWCITQALPERAYARYSRLEHAFAKLRWDNNHRRNPKRKDGSYLDPLPLKASDYEAVIPPDLRILVTEDLQNYAWVSVYGDDVVIPSCVHPYWVAILEKLGIRANLSKSFWDSRFRESCGGDWIKLGGKVYSATPAYWPRHELSCFIYNDRSGQIEWARDNVISDWNGRETVKTTELCGLIRLQHDLYGSFPEACAFLTKFLVDRVPNLTTSLAGTECDDLWGPYERGVKVVFPSAVRDWVLLTSETEKYVKVLMDEDGTPTEVNVREAHLSPTFEYPEYTAQEPATDEVVSSQTEGSPDKGANAAGKAAPVLKKNWGKDAEMIVSLYGLMRSTSIMRPRSYERVNAPIAVDDGYAIQRVNIPCDHPSNHAALLVAPRVEWKLKLS